MSGLSPSVDGRGRGSCPRCGPNGWDAGVWSRYTYLLGQYLGDGHLVTSARIPVLRIYVCTDYPDITDAVIEAIALVRGTRPGVVGRRNSERVAGVQSYWTHWPCLFPQHGPGRKHERRIVLAAWQQEVVLADPWPLIRGLIHSDGCRAINRVVARGRDYSYPRYFFANESRDILAIMGWALDLASVKWRYNRPNSISIARRDAVALLDEQVGPKEPSAGAGSHSGCASSRRHRRSPCPADPCSPVRRC